MIDVTVPGLSVEAAYRKLYLLPGAPRELIDAAYAELSQRPDAADLHLAYETIVRASELPVIEEFPRRMSPWQLLHLQPDAPRALLSIAYGIWLDGAEPLEIATPPPLPVPVKDPNEDTRECDIISVFEELDGAELVQAIRSIRTEPDGSEGVPGPEVFLFASEEFNPDEVWGDRAEGCTRTELHEQAVAGPSLIAADGTTFALSKRPLRIGTQPSCDVAVRLNGRLEARVWLNKGRVLIHALGDASQVLVNGSPVTWGVLNDGDELSVGSERMTFRTLAGTKT